MKITFIFSCSGMFRDVPCYGFYRRLIVFFRVFNIGPPSLESSNFRKVLLVVFGLKNFLFSCLGFAALGPGFLGPRPCVTIKSF